MSNSNESDGNKLHNAVLVENESVNVPTSRFRSASYTRKEQLMAGRPRKKPEELVHNTRQRVFHQIEANPEFDAAIEKIRIYMAAKRSTPTNPYPVSKISKAAAVRLATVWFAKEKLGG